MKTIFRNSDFSILLALVIPLTLTGLVQSAVWFFETLFLAHLGPQTLAAGSLVTWLLSTITAILFGALSSINILVAHQYGKGEEKNIAYLARDGLLLAFLFAIPAFLLFWNMSPIFLLFGQSTEVVELAKSYLHSLSFGLFPSFLIIACLEVMMGLGHARTILIFSVLTVLLNIFFSYVFIFGKFGFPILGIAGAGWGITVSDWIVVLLLAIFVTCHASYKLYFRYVISLKPTKYLIELLEIGLPMGLMYCVEVGFFFALTVCIGLFGDEIQAANQVALQYLGLFMAPMFAIAQGVTVRIGHLMGARKNDALAMTNYFGLIISLIFTFVIAIFYWFFPDYLIAIDFDISRPDNFEIAAWVKKFLIVSAIFQIFEGVRVVYFGSLRGLKDTQFTLLISILTFWLVALPLGYVLSSQHLLGVIGYWWGMVIGAALSVVILQMRFKNKLNYLKKNSFVNV